MTKITEENLSQIKYAEHINVTKGYIRRLIKENRLHLIKGKLNIEKEYPKVVSGHCLRSFSIIGIAIVNSYKNHSQTSIL